MSESLLTETQSKHNSRGERTNAFESSRRKVLRAATVGSPIFSSFIFGTGLVQAETDTVSPQSTGENTAEPEATIRIDVTAPLAWEVTSVEGDAAEAETNEDNPRISLLTDTRYTFVNDAGRYSHPLEFRDADGEPLLSQPATGSFENDDNVAWVNEGDRVSFTLTRPLADRIADYICTKHGSMNGPITTEFPPSTLVINSIDIPGEVTSDEMVTINVMIEETAGNEPVEPVANVRIESSDETVVYKGDFQLDKIDASGSQTFAVPSELRESNDTNTETEGGVRVENDGLIFEADSESEYTVFVEANAENTNQIVNNRTMTVRSAPEPEADDTDIDDDMEGKNDSDAETETDEELAAADETPGFGIGSGITALGAGGYMLRRRFENDSD